MNRMLGWLEERLPDVASFGVKVLLSILIFYIGIRLIRWVLRLLTQSLEKAGIDKGVNTFICSFSKILLYCILIFNIATQYGVTESSVAALLGFAGLTIGLGLQEGLKNLAGGVMILIFKPFLVGDYIIDNETGCEGTVVKIEICYTTLASTDDKRIVVPNGTLSNSSVTNVTARDQRLLEIKIGISYDSSLQTAKKILEDLLKQEPRIFTDQEKVVFVDALMDNSMVLGMRAWVKTEEYWAVRWDLNEKIKLSFDENHIRMANSRLEVRVNNKMSQETE